jgi:hypothetical protein
MIPTLHPFRTFLVLAILIGPTVPLSARDWFVDNSAAAGGDGSATSPLRSLKAVQAASAPGDAILLRPGSGPYTEGIQLKEKQVLTGSGGRPVIAPLNADGIVLAPRTTVTGVTVRAVAYAAIRGRAIGENVLRDVLIETAGDADGVVLVETAAAVTIEVGGLSGSGNGTALVFDGGAGAISISGFPVTQKSGAALAVRNRTGAVTLGKGTLLTVTDGRRDALVMTANRGAITIAEPLRIVTSGASALIVRDSASVTVTGPGNVLATRGARGVHVSGSGVYADFLSISVDGGDADVEHGIVLEKMRGQFRVSGSAATAGSGGTIRGIRHRGIVLVDAANVTLRNMTLERASSVNGTNCGRPAASGEHLRCNGAVYMKDAENVELDGLRLQGAAQNGIHGDTIRGFALTNSELSGAGDEIDEAGVLLRNVAGKVRFDDVRIRESAARQIEIVNDTGEAAIDVSRSTIGSGRKSTGQQGILITAGGDSRVRLTVVGSTIANNASTALHVIAAGTAMVDASVSGTQFRDNGSALLLMTTDSAKLALRIEDNTISGNSTSAVTVTGLSREGWSGTIARNVIGVTGKAGSGASCGGGCSGIMLTGGGRGTSSAAVTGNTLQQVDSAIRTRSGDSGTLNVRITGNIIRERAAGSSPAIVVQAGMRPKDSARICAEVGGTRELANVVSGDWGTSAAGAAIQFLHRFPSTLMSIAGYAGDPAASANVAKFVAGRNRGAAVAADITGTLTLADHCAIR